MGYEDTCIFGRYLPKEIIRLSSHLTNQRGAMFGLDARLAMVIFATLSVVGGFLGYGRISMAKDARLISELQSMDQAVRTYQADMGTFFPFTLEESDGITDLEALWKKDRLKPGFQVHWNGPYVHEHTLDHKHYGRWGVYYSQADREQICTTQSNCYLWLRLTDVPADRWAVVNQTLDEAYGDEPEEDGTAIHSGLVQADSNLDPRQLFYRSVERPR